MRQNILAIIWYHSKFTADVNKLKQKCTYFEYVIRYRELRFYIFAPHRIQINMYISVYRE